MKREINPKDIFPKRLKESRVWRDLTQERLGEKAGINTSMIAHFECGSRLPSLSNLQSISKALAISTDYLIGNSDSHDTVSDDIIYNLRYATFEEYMLMLHMSEYIAARHENQSARSKE